MQSYPTHLPPAIFGHYQTIICYYAYGYQWFNIITIYTYGSRANVKLAPAYTQQALIRTHLGA
jgi:hypothetical protein